MNELNPSQKAISEELEGMIVVDAGPGTGKTHTIVDRFLNILKKEDVDVGDLLLLTFTRNAAGEMEERIRDKMTRSGLSASSGFIQTSTFDSLCYSVVMESPDTVSRFFRMKEMLTRGATLIENETLNREYFSDFFDRFMIAHPDEYGAHGIIASQNVSELYGIINKLMSRGIMPLKNGWFGDDDGRMLKGWPEKIEEALSTMNGEVSTRGNSKLSHFLCGEFSGDQAFGLLGVSPAEPLSDEMIHEASFDDRSELLALIHDIYYEYIRNCINDDRLTYGLVSSFAFIILYDNRKVRDRMSVRYLMIDEFQDTNENQLMIALMLLKEPNLCVVGDWKQGIYGFRHVSVENITDFERRVRDLRKVLNGDIMRVPFHIPEVKRLSLDMNYRSSQIIIDAAYDSLYIKATEKENVDREYLDKNITRITAQREDVRDDTRMEFVSAVSQEEEVSEVMRTIARYINGDFIIHDDDGPRRPCFGDIAILCRNSKMCRAINDAAASSGMPAFLQGDMNVMSTREGKLTLAWLKYINNKDDDWGIGPIMADAGYTLDDILKMRSDPPAAIYGLRRSLIRKKRRITDLISSIFAFYGLNNDITQAIISIISSSHRNSLLTISDVIGMIERDIEDHTTYPVEGMLDRKAVTIQTMHKSKGLEYPIVIIAGMDQGVMPSTQGERSAYSFNRLTGIRCRRDVSSFGGDYSKITKSWKTILAECTVTRDYSEERRLMFVALSRAKQYVTVISGPRPSSFFKYLSAGKIRECGEGGIDQLNIKEEIELIAAPTIKEFGSRRINLGVHDIMRSAGSLRPDAETDEFSGKGKEYGTEIHEAAYAMAAGHEVEDVRPEVSVIRDILSAASDADLVLPEIECSLPFNDLNVTLKGIIDLLVVRPDMIEIHDYKTDADASYESEYRVQLSVYAHAASEFYRRPAKCIIDYVSLNKAVEFEPLSKETIAQRVRECCIGPSSVESP
ncbi:MAG: UvrD-helicase domain-containing protein [Candidatus Methanoplasma sp.]|jgi:ATP-dependent exoDNAse (exonuclease V) beta subunit|nr:UvrD-helicase domain-containing protein [Candidatus Methanoplasma sp.]